MTSNGSGDRSLPDIFGNLQLSGTEHSVAHQEDPCKMPQSEPNGNCDDASDTSDTSSIIVVDSDASTVVSFIDPDDLISHYSSSPDADHSNGNILSITIEETESEAADVHGPGDTPTDSATSGADMDAAKSSSKPSRSILKRSSYSLTDDDSQSKKRMEEMTASSSSPKIVTRSGRAVRMRLDFKFDYSSSQPEDDEHAQDSLRLSAPDSDDEDYQLNGSNEEPNWSKCKRRRSSHESNQTSTSTDSSSLEATLIYLDLEPPVATIMHEPFDNLVLDGDADLKTKIQKFLGLIPRRRKLYNPEDHLQPDEPPYEEPPPSRSFLQVISATQPPEHPQVSPSPKGLNVSHRQPLTMLNASTMESETPDFSNAPIDLTELPSKKWRANNCRRHKSCMACLEQHPHLYSFIDSLNRAAAIKLCHPQALTYRKTEFESCKEALAKLLFNIFNHVVFHCALQPDIVWARSLGKPCICEMSIDSSGQRSARLLLWKGINRSSQLIKPLLHEMCHAAAFVFNRETGHGDACRQWCYQANQQLDEMTLIDVCYSRFKYVCSMCGRGSYGLMDFAANKEMLRCHYCQFEVVVEPWSSDCAYDCIRPDTTMTEFKTFIFDRYQQLTEEGEEEGGRSHTTKMRCLNQQFLKMKHEAAACD